MNGEDDLQDDDLHDLQNGNGDGDGNGNGNVDGDNDNDDNVLSRRSE